MQLVTLETPCSSGSSRVGRAHSFEALAGVIGCIGNADFGVAALAQINRAMPVCSLSVYQLYPDAPPLMYASGSFEFNDYTVDAFEAYRRGVYQRDQTFLAATEQTRAGRSALMHWNAREIPLAHRRPIYSRHGLRERVSLVAPEAGGGVLALNLYRSDAQPAFDDDEIDLLRDWGGPLVSSVRSHLRVLGAAMPSRMTTPVTAVPAAARSMTSGDDPTLSTLSTLSIRSLPRREREVCERLLRGWTYDGIAADLGIGTGTVKTYRDRAFDRLGLHHRNELFALVLARPPWLVVCNSRSSPSAEGNRPNHQPRLRGTPASKHRHHVRLTGNRIRP